MGSLRPSVPYRKQAYSNQELLQRKEGPAATCARKIHCNTHSKLWSRRTDGSRGISPGPDLKHTQAVSHGGNSAKDSWPSWAVQGRVFRFRKAERHQCEIARGSRRKRRRAETEKNIPTAQRQIWWDSWQVGGNGYHRYQRWANRMQWYSNVVLVPKKDGENIRASLDMTDANKYIKRTRHAIPTLREQETRLNGTKYFSHLDMNNAYMQLELAEESRKLTTFYTHRCWNALKAAFRGQQRGRDL